METEMPEIPTEILEMVRERLHPDPEMEGWQRFASGDVRKAIWELRKRDHRYRPLSTQIVASVVSGIDPKFMARQWYDVEGVRMMRFRYDPERPDRIAKGRRQLRRNLKKAEAVRRMFSPVPSWQLPPIEPDHPVYREIEAKLANNERGRRLLSMRGEIWEKRRFDRVFVYGLFSVYQLSVPGFVGRVWVDVEIPEEIRLRSLESIANCSQLPKIDLAGTPCEWHLREACNAFECTPADLEFHGELPTAEKLTYEICVRYVGPGPRHGRWGFHALGLTRRDRS